MVSQDEVWSQLPLQDFEVLKDVSRNFTTVDNKELGWMGEWEAGTLVTNCCNIVLLAAVADSCSFLFAITTHWIPADDSDAVGIVPLCQHRHGSWAHYSSWTTKITLADFYYKPDRQGASGYLGPHSILRLALIFHEWFLKSQLAIFVCLLSVTASLSSRPQTTVPLSTPSWPSSSSFSSQNT